MAVDTGIGIWQTVALLGAAVVAVPLFKRLGLGSVLGYLAGGLVIGPFGLGLVHRPAKRSCTSPSSASCMFLFIIGLEMQPSRLWSLRARDLRPRRARRSWPAARCSTGVGLAARLSARRGRFVAGMGFVLSSTADRHADARGARRARRRRQGQRIVVDPAARGSGDRAAAGARRLPGAAAAAEPSARRAGWQIGIALGRASRRWWPPAAGCSTRCSACSPPRGRAR